MSVRLAEETRGRLLYAFGHLVSSHDVEDPHHADSGELAMEILEETFTPSMILAVRELAEHVAHNYTYTGESEELERRIQAGEV